MPGDSFVSRGREQVDTKQKRARIGFVMVCVLGFLAGCTANPVQAADKRSYADFDIAFLPAGSAVPTSMVITPDDGDAFLDAVMTTNANDNRITWKSDKHFQVRFVQVDDQDQPLRPGKELGDENKDWNDSKQVGKDWVYTRCASRQAAAGARRRRLPRNTSSSSSRRRSSSTRSSSSVAEVATA
jgi:hypothetical protein